LNSDRRFVQVQLYRWPPEVMESRSELEFMPNLVGKFANIGLRIWAMIAWLYRVARLFRFVE